MIIVAISDNCSVPNVPVWRHMSFVKSHDIRTPTHDFQPLTFLMLFLTWPSTHDHKSVTLCCYDLQLAKSEVHYVDDETESGFDTTFLDDKVGLKQ